MASSASTRRSSTRSRSGSNDARISLAGGGARKTALCNLPGAGLILAHENPRRALVPRHPRPVVPRRAHRRRRGRGGGGSRGGQLGHPADPQARSEEHTSELQSLRHLVCRLLLEKKKK